MSNEPGDKREWSRYSGPLGPLERKVTPEDASFWQWLQMQSGRTKFHLGCASLVLLLALGSCLFPFLIGALSTTSAVLLEQKEALFPPVTLAPRLTITPTVTVRQRALARALSPSVTPTPTPVAHAVPTRVSVPPTPTPVPTPIVATRVPPTPTSVLTPTSTPGLVQPAIQACRSVNCNPWGYTFVPGKRIYAAPSAFCQYFACIRNFSHGKGYVVECQDGKYSKSGGRSGVCSDHRGYWRTLYAH